MKSVCPEGTLSTPLSMYGCNTLIAPSQKKLALLSSGLPANSSMLYGPFLPVSLPSLSRTPSPVSSEVPCWTPTLKLSNVT